MENLDKLYCEVPPTKLRKKDERFRPARTSPFWLWVADRFFYGMLENRFYAFRSEDENADWATILLTNVNEQGIIEP